jgi:hypothetical protein
MKNVSPTGVKVKAAARTVPVVKTETKATEPNTSAAIGALAAIAATVAKPVVVAEPKKVEPVKVAPAFVRTEQNGRKSYAPGSVGDQIWTVADTLKEKLPGIAVTAASVRLALPEVNVRSISCGLTHWRKFHGISGKPVAAVVTTGPAA